MTTLVIGSEAVCSDGYRGEVLALVVDPAARTVTHLVVEPHGRAGLARLVPLELADLAGHADPADPADLADAGPGQIRLRCTEAEFMSLEPAEETLAEFVPGYPDPVQLLPPGWHGAGGATADGGTILRIPERETIDIVPPGEVEERRGDHVHATDGGIGHLRGLRIDPGSTPGDPPAGQGRARVGAPGRGYPGRDGGRVRRRHPAQRDPAAGPGPAAGRPRSLRRIAPFPAWRPGQVMYVRPFCRFAARGDGEPETRAQPEWL